MAAMTTAGIAARAAGGAESDAMIAAASADEASAAVPEAATAGIATALATSDLGERDHAGIAPATRGGAKIVEVANTVAKEKNDEVADDRDEISGKGVIGAKDCATTCYRSASRRLSSPRDPPLRV